MSTAPTPHLSHRAIALPSPLIPGPRAAQQVPSYDMLGTLESPALVSTSSPTPEPFLVLKVLSCVHSSVSPFYRRGSRLRESLKIPGSHNEGQNPGCRSGF